MLLTIQRMDPDGCSTWCEPLHLALTVARPKSPIFTVSPSCKKMSTPLSRNVQLSPHFKYVTCFYLQLEKDTVGLHVTMNDVLCMQIAENDKRKLEILFSFPLIRKMTFILTPCPEPSAWQCL